MAESKFSIRQLIITFYIYIARRAFRREERRDETDAINFPLNYMYFYFISFLSLFQYLMFR